MLKICQKYNLVYGAIDKYIGTVPDKNLKHIEEFKVAEEDECLMKGRVYYSPFGEESQMSDIKYSSIKDREEESRILKEKRLKEKEMFGDDYHIRISMLSLGRLSFGSSTSVDMSCPLEIAAPLKDFNMTNAEVNNFKISGSMYSRPP